jgi:hypothetical protein
MSLVSINLTDLASLPSRTSRQEMMRLDIMILSLSCHWVAPFLPQ